MNLERDPQLSQMVMGSGIQTGNPTMDMLLNVLLGNSLAPAPGKGQSILDAYRLRERSRDYMSLMRKGFGTSMLANHLGGPGGINTDGMFGGILSQVASMSGVMDNPLMQAMNGGNPVKALMGLKANMTGMTMGQTFGHVSNADNETVLAAYRGMRDQLFNTRTITNVDLADQQKEKSATLLKDLSPESRKKLSNFITKGDDGTEAFDFDSFDEVNRKQTASFDDQGSTLTRKYEGYSKELTEIKEARAKYIKEQEQAGFDPKKATEAYDTKAKGRTDELHRKLQENGKEFEQLQKAKDEYQKDIAAAIDASKSVMNFRSQKGEKVSLSVNPESMRGFRIQDLTKSMTMMMDLNMVKLDSKIKDDPNISTKDKAATLASLTAKHSVKVLSAVRDLTGAETADEATNQLNTLLGVSKVNLATEKGSSEVESLLRNVKAAGKTAGIGLTAITEIINQVSQLSASHPQLRYTGGTSHLTTSIGALNMTAAMTAHMGGDWVRQNGGQAELSYNITQNAAEAKIQPISKEIKGLVGYLIGNSALDAKDRSGVSKRDMLLGELNKWTNNKDSIFGTGEHGFMDADKARMVKTMAAQIGTDPMNLFNALRAESSQVSGQIFSDANTQYNFDAAGEHGSPYDYVMQSLRQELINKGLDETEIKSTEDDFKKEMANRRITGDTPEQILAKVRKTKGGKSFTISSGDNSLMERNVQNKQLMLGFTLHQNLQDPKFQKELATLKSTQKTYAEEETRLDKELAAMHQPFMDSIMQAFMSDAFGKGKEELLSIISTPEGQKRAGEMMDALTSNSATTTSASFKHVMLESLGGAEGASEEAIRKNLALEGITDESQINAVLRRRRAWKENSSGLGAFDKATKTNTLGAIQSAYNDLKKNGSLDAERLKKLGVSVGVIREAGAFMDSTGIDANKYGGYTGEEYMKNGPVSSILAKSANIGFEASKRKLLDLKSREASDYYKGLEGTEAADRSHDALGLLADAGYIKRQNGKTGNTWGDFDWGATSFDGFLRDRETFGGIQGGKLFNTLTGKGIGDVKTAYGIAGAMSDEDKRFLVEKGAVNLNADGSVKSWDDEKLKKLQTQGKGFKAASENTLFDQLGQRIDEASAAKDRNLQGANMNASGEQLREFAGSVTSGAGLISKQLSEIANLMKGALAH